MKKVFKWIKEHVRPHYRYKGSAKYEDKDSKFDIDDLKKKSEIGIKINFKF